MRLPANTGKSLIGSNQRFFRSGKIPCEYTGRKTRCYKIKKEDVIAYLENRKVFPESYSAPAGWYKDDYTVQMEEQVPPIVREHLRLYYTELLSDYPDVLTTQEVSKITVAHPHPARLFRLAENT